MIGKAWPLGLTLAVAVQAGCNGATEPDASPVAGTVTLVNRVRAVVASENCSNDCASTIEATLRQRLDTAAIAVDVERKVVDLSFERSSPFASGSFRQAIKEGGGDVQKVEIEACGTIDTADGRSWITSGSTRLLLEGSAPTVTGVDLCVTGELRDLIQPPKLVVGSF